MRKMLPQIFSNFVPAIKQTVKPCISAIFSQQTRNTFILKRRYNPLLMKLGGKPRRLRGRYYIYDLVEDTNNKKRDPLKVILTEYVEGFGHAGDVLSLKPTVARNKLLLPKHAIYATPENLEKCKELIEHRGETAFRHSSKFAPYTQKYLSKTVIFVKLNAENPWTIQKWHITFALREAGFMAPESAIELPQEPISGPDSKIHLKDFAIYVTINNCERFPVRCRIYQWHANVLKNDEITPEMRGTISEPLLAEQADLLKTIPEPEIPTADRYTLAHF